MGMASFVDRLRDLLNDAMHFRGLWEARSAMVIPEVTQLVSHDVQIRAFADDLQKRLDAYGPLLENIIRQLNELLEYATDPAVQLVEEVLQLRIARDSLLGQLNHACKERDALQADVLKMQFLSQQAHYAKKHAEFAADQLREQAAAQVARLEHDIKSLKGELVSKDKAHGEAIKKFKAEHSTEVANLRTAHAIEMNDLRKRAELALNRPIPSKDQSRQEEFSELLSKSPSPRLQTQSTPIKKGTSNSPRKKR